MVGERDKQWITHEIWEDEDTGKKIVLRRVNLNALPANELKDEMSSILYQCSPPGRIEAMKGYVLSLPDDYPEKPLALRYLKIAENASTDADRNRYVAEVRIQIERSEARTKGRENKSNKRVAAERGVGIRKEKSKDCQNWVNNMAKNLLNEGKPSQNIVSIIHSRIRKEIDARTANDAEDYPGNKTPSTRTLRKWTEEIRSKDCLEN